MPRMAKDKSPIVLRLENEHYTYMVPPQSIGWLWETSVPHKRLLQGSAGPGSQSCVATPSLHSLSSCLGRRQGATRDENSGSVDENSSCSLLRRLCAMLLRDPFWPPLNPLRASLRRLKGHVLGKVVALRPRLQESTCPQNHV